MTDDLSRILAPDLVDEGDRIVEGALRPRTLDEYIGQREVKANLSVLLSAAKGRGEAADHVLLYGPPGLGKTTLATIIARELGVNVRYTCGPAVERAGDLAAILTALDERDVLFIDEIHRLNRAVEEILYPAMEDYALDVMIGKGPCARSLRLSLKPFTVVGATTRAGRISSPLRDRFGATYRLDFYEEDDLDRDRRPLGADPRRRDRRRPRRGRSRPAAGARRGSSTGCSSGPATTPRSTATAASTRRPRRPRCARWRSTTRASTRRTASSSPRSSRSSPRGRSASRRSPPSSSEEVETIEDVYEPFLLRLGFLDRTPQGRIATEAARAHLAKLGYEIPPPRRGEPDMPGFWDDPARSDAAPPATRSSSRRRPTARRAPGSAASS